MPEAALVSIIVPHLNDHVRLERCLDSLVSQSWPAEQLEIIVVDNGSATPLDRVAAKFPNIRSAVELQKGCGAARNCGIALSRGSVLCFTDSDVIADRDWVARLLAALDHADIVGGRIEVFPASADYPTTAELYERVFAFRNETYIRQKKFSVGCSMATRREVFAQVGPFLGAAFPEDLEWGQRAYSMGFRLAYAEDAVLHHPARPCLDALRAKVDRTLDHQMNLLCVRLGGLFWLFWFAMVAALCLPPLIKLGEVAVTVRLVGLRQRLGVSMVVLDLRYHRVRRLLRFAASRPAMRPRASSAQR